RAGPLGRRLSVQHRRQRGPGLAAVHARHRAGRPHLRLERPAAALRAGGRPRPSGAAAPGPPGAPARRAHRAARLGRPGHPPAAPDRDELLTLMAASWEAFAAELGLPHLRLVAREAAPGADLLAFDEAEGRVVVLHVTGETVEWQVARALSAAAEVAGWDAA